MPWLAKMPFCRERWKKAYNIFQCKLVVVYMKTDEKGFQEAAKKTGKSENKIFHSFSFLRVLRFFKFSHSMLLSIFLKSSPFFLGKGPSGKRQDWFENSNFPHYPTPSPQGLASVRKSIAHFVLLTFFPSIFPYFLVSNFFLFVVNKKKSPTFMNDL